MTWEERNEQAIASLFPGLQSRARGHIAGCKAIGIPLLITQGLRSYDEQALLWSYGRTKKSPSPCRHGGVERPIGTCSEHPLGATVTNAAPGFSWHQFGLAFDCYPDDPAAQQLDPDFNPAHPEWKKMLAVGHSYQLAEGAQWRTYPDFPHFYPEELLPTPDSHIRMLYTAGGINEVWDWVSSVMKSQPPAPEAEVPQI